MGGAPIVGCLGSRIPREWKGSDFNFPLLTMMIGAGAELTTCCSFCNIPDDGRDSNVRDWRLLTDIDW